MSIGALCVHGKWNYGKPNIGNNQFFLDYHTLTEKENIFNHSLTKFYMTVLAAGITEDMLSIEKAFDISECVSQICNNPNIFEYWYAAVLGGRYKFAADILSANTDDFCLFRGFEYVLHEHGDFIDLFTENGSNENYRRILLNILVQDYLHGGKCVYEYVRRYSAEKELSDNACLDRALLSAGSADIIMEAVSRETDYVIRTAPDAADTPEYDRLTKELMCRCAKLGMRLKKFHSFRDIFVSVHRMSAAVIPEKMAELIDLGTEVSFSTGTQPDEYNDFCEPVHFDDPDKTAELEYIAERFRLEYGRKLTVTANAPEDLMTPKNWDNIEIILSDNTVHKLCSDSRLLKKIIRKKILSDDNMWELIKCCTEAVINPKYSKNALRTLRILDSAEKSK